MDLQSAPEPTQPQSTTTKSPSIQQTTIRKKPSLVGQFLALSTVTKIIAAAAGLVFLIFITLLVSTVLFGSDNSQTNKSTNTADLVEKERQRQIAASEAAIRQQKPINQLQKAYDDIVGSDSSKRTLTIDTNGTALIEYEIASTNGQIILKTSYENFADLASRVFNIPTISRLNVTTYANKFTDSFGKPNVFAVKLQLTKETNSQINWSLKKYAYGDYATILTLHEINPDLTKDYKSLTKKNN